MGLCTDASSYVSTPLTVVSDALLSMQDNLVKSGRARTRWLHNTIYRECIADSSVSVQCEVTSLQSRA